MDAREAGFTTIELIVAVAMIVVLLAAGGAWMFAMQPGSLGAAVHDVDADFAAAQSIAGSSGNGATVVFAPRAGGIAGFTMRVYSGRPTAAGAVTPTSVMRVESATLLNEAHFGTPPFALFLNSAGFVTGVGAYPPLDANQTPTFMPIAQQPPCPAGGVKLRFTSPQGAQQTRTYACNTAIASGGAAQATPTPNPLRVSPPYLLAHDTSDAGPLRFKAAEYGYYHWYASASNGIACATQASDTGAAPAVFATPWPYASASPAAESAASPAPPAGAPYTWPAGDPNDPPAWFALAPVLHNGGLCTVTVQDDYGQQGSVTVQVMGDLTASTSSLTLTVGQGTGTIGFSKTFDSEQLMLSAGGACASILSVSIASGAYPATPSRTPALASITVTPKAAGTCTLLVQDQYGERLSFGITVKASDFSTWPASLVVGANGTPVAQESSAPVTIAEAGTDPAHILNALLGGGIALAATSYSGPCYAQAFMSGTSGAVDTTLFSKNPNAAVAIGVSITSDGCILNADGTAPYGESSGGTSGTPTGVMIADEPAGSGQTGTFSLPPSNACSSFTSFGPWSPNQGYNEPQASLSATGANQGSCTVDISDGHSTQTPAPDAGQVAVNVGGKELVTVHYAQICHSQKTGADFSQVCTDSTSAYTNASCISSQSWTENNSGAAGTWSKSYDQYVVANPAPTTAAAWGAYLATQSQNDPWGTGTPVGSGPNITTTSCP